MAEQCANKMREGAENDAKVEADEVAKMTSSDLLTENPDTALRAGYNGRRYVPWAFRGMSREQRQNYLDQQQNQIEEVRAREKNCKGHGFCRLETRTRNFESQRDDEPLIFGA